MNFLLQPPIPWRVVETAAAWHLRSQHQACRNALVASTALVQRRRELNEVEEFLAAYDVREDSAVRPLTASTDEPAQAPAAHRSTA